MHHFPIEKPPPEVERDKEIARGIINRINEGKNAYDHLTPI